MAEVNILLVEDDEVDVMAVKRALKTLKIANPFFRAADGIEALEMLRGTGGKKQLPSPYIVLLDLNMPRMDGLEFLDELRQDPALHRSVVFVMTTSAAPCSNMGQAASSTSARRRGCRRITTRSASRWNIGPKRRPTACFSASAMRPGTGAR